MPPQISSRISIRLDADTRAGISQYMANNGVTQSQALRLIVEQGLQAINSQDIQVHRAAVKEGIFRGTSIVKSKLHHILDEAIREI